MWKGRFWGEAGDWPGDETEVTCWSDFVRYLEGV